MKPRAARAEDFDAILALNDESLRFLSPLDRTRLVQLDAEAALHQVLEFEGKFAAFVLALREGASYDSVNYRWFLARYPHFLYVGRVVVSSTARGQGLGRALYAAVFEYAKAEGIAIVTAEFDMEPPNPVSEKFHASFGFKEVGRQCIAKRSKWVSLQVAEVE
jgi:predicted GNAT superfamily acetyltransferase